jgi:hypothetical protein
MHSAVIVTHPNPQSDKGRYIYMSHGNLPIYVDEEYMEANAPQPYEILPIFQEATNPNVKYLCVANPKHIIEWGDYTN